MSKIKINYKSGHSIIVKCKEFTVTRDGGKIIKVEWSGLVKPTSILHIGVDAIESVIEL
jgi:hypothetical protein